MNQEMLDQLKKRVRDLNYSELSLFTDFTKPYEDYRLRGPKSHGKVLVHVKSFAYLSVMIPNSHNPTIDDWVKAVMESHRRLCHAEVGGSGAVVMQREYTIDSGPSILTGYNRISAEVATVQFANDGKTYLSGKEYAA